MIEEADEAEGGGLEEEAGLVGDAVQGLLSLEGEVSGELRVEEEGGELVGHLLDAGVAGGGGFLDDVVEAAAEVEEVGGRLRGANGKEAADGLPRDVALVGRVGGQGDAGGGVVGGRVVVHVVQVDVVQVVHVDVHGCFCWWEVRR